MIVIVASIVFTTFTDYRYALIILLAYGYFLFFIGNILNINVPVGVPFDLLLFTIFLAVLIKNNFSTSIPRLETNPYKTPLGIILLIWAGFDFLTIFNPLTYGLYLGVPPIRVTLTFVLGFYIFYQASTSYSFIKLFIIAFLALSILGGLYGLKQEFIGLADWEWKWLTSDPRRYSLFYQWGRIRKWSFFSDVSTFGILMSFSAISCFILMLGPFKRVYRITALVGGVVMSLAMSYSGTRTAVAMIPLGLAIYFMLNMTNRITIGIAIGTLVVFLAVMYGPFYGPTFTRIRSTFNSDDPSLDFRGYKRKKLQEYVMSHPLGGGLGTANETAGRLSSTYDPDNGYLRTALDKGFPGLLLQFLFFFTILFTAIEAYFSCKNQKIKFIYASFIGSFFAISVAQFFQDAIEQKPTYYIITAYLAFIVRLKDYDS
ncbi:MAG: O-antigen ligase family protein [Bacteroidota bacterium]